MVDPKSKIEAVNKDLSEYSEDLYGNIGSLESYAEPFIKERLKGMQAALRARSESASTILGTIAHEKMPQPMTDKFIDIVEKSFLIDLSEMARKAIRMLDDKDKWDEDKWSDSVAEERREVLNRKKNYYDEHIDRIGDVSHIPSR